MRKELRVIVLMITVILLLSACGKDKIVESSQPVIEGEVQVTTDEDKGIGNVMVEEKHDTEDKDSTQNNDIDLENLDINEVERVEEPVLVQKEIEDIASIELVKRLKIGWNLGNTLDATGGSGLGTETSWGNPITTKEMIDLVKERGFNVLRVPTTWE